MTTKIVCLGWGSLVWDPEDLAIQSRWFEDGPAVHVEFGRQSKDGRMTLVLAKTEKSVFALWAIMGVKDLASARANLRVREGVYEKNEIKHIGAWSVGEPSPQLIPSLAEWAAAHEVLHVVWTNLPPKFAGSESMPSAQQVVEYLSELTDKQVDAAERYVRFAPRQIDTAYRRCIENALNWTPQDPR